MAEAGSKAPAGGLKLRAQDEEDLAVFAACLQDAVTRRADMIYQRRERRFAMAVKRYCWEAPPSPRGGWRVHCGVHFDDVLKVEVSGLDREPMDQVLELLTIVQEPDRDGRKRLTLVFCGGGAVRLEVECIAAQLRDMSAPWDTPRKPEHRIEPTMQPEPEG